MSQVYLARLRQIRDEFNATVEALRYVSRHWNAANIAAEIPPNISPRHFESALSHAEVTFFVRLHAEFEGILKDHLTVNHGVSLPTNPKIDWLISQTTKQENITLDSVLRQKLNEVRELRNVIAHSGRQSLGALRFQDALSRINAFISRLPDPLP